MSGVVKAIGIVAMIGFAVLTAFPTGGASLLGLSAIGAGFATTAFAVTAIAAGIGASLLAPRPAVPEASPATADRLNVNIVVNTPRKIIFGRTAMATDLRDQELTDGQAYLHRFIVAAAHEVQSIDEIYFDDKLAWSLAGGITGDFLGYLAVTPIKAGTAANAINISPRMGSSRRFTGCAYVHIRYKLTGDGNSTESPFAQQIPTRVTIVGKGAKIYDPRLDSTVPGGSGPQRADDQTTWAWSDSAARNPALQLLWYHLGWRIQNPVTGVWRLSVGKGMPARRLDLPSFITAANLCDEAILRAGGTGTEPRYRSDGIFSEGDPTSTVVDQLKAAMNADLDDVDGKIRVTVFHNDLATPICDLTTDDVIGEFTWAQTAPLNDSFNIIRGTWVDPVSLYQTPDFPAIEMESPDGIDRIETINFGTVQSVSQAQRLAKQRLARMLYSGTFSATFSHRAWKATKNDVIRLSFSPLGWTNQLFRVAAADVQVDGRVPLVLRVEHPDIYLWDAEEAPAVQPADPTTYNPQLNPIVQAIGVELPAIIAKSARRGTAFPTADESSEGQLFVRLDLDNRLFIRVPGDGLLRNAGELVTIGGQPVRFSVWREVSDGRVITALADALAAQQAADQAQADAAAANARLVAIASDGLLTPDEKPRVQLDRDIIVAEQAGIDAQAAALGITTEKVAYDNAVSALTAYLATLTTPTLWSDLTGDTTIVGATFRAKFADVYTAKQALLDKIAASLKVLANSAQADATAALAQLVNIASDNVLSRGEKPQVERDFTAITATWLALDAKATALGIGAAEQAAADAAMGALGTYLAGLSPGWNNPLVDTPIVGATFFSKWEDAYTAVAALQAAIQGQPGESGTSPYLLALSNSIFAVRTDPYGAVKAGQLPQSCTISLTQGGTSVLGSAMINVVASSSDITAGYSSGTISLATANTEGFVDVIATVASAEVARGRILVRRLPDALPPESQISFSKIVEIGATGTAFNIPPETVGVILANSSGQLLAKLGGSYTPAGGNEVFMAVAVAYRPAGGSTWSYTTTQNGSGAYFDEESGIFTPGTVSTAPTISGLSAGAAYEVGAAVKRNSSVASLGEFSGAFSVSQ